VTSINSALAGRPAKSGIILFTLIAGAIVANINTSISNVALPSIGKALQASDTQLTGITDAYQLGIASTVLYLGAVGDRHGRRKLLLIGAGLCVPFSVLSAISQSATALICAQIAVGVACGMLYPTTLSLISSLWSGVSKTKAIALWTGIGTGASVLGPILGGWMLGELWWGSVFLISVPIALVVLLLGFIVLPRRAGETSNPVDHKGGGLSVVMISAFVLFVVFLPKGLTPATILLFVVTLISGSFFWWRERRATNPLFDLRAAAIPTFWVSFVAGLIAFGALIGALFIGQQFSQNVLGQTPLTAVLLTLGLAVAMMPSAVLGGHLIESKGTRIPFALGLAFIACGFIVIFLMWYPGTSLTWVVVAYVLIGIGTGFASTAAMRSLSMSLPVSKAGMSSGSADLTKDLGGAVFQALLGTLLAIAYSRYFVNTFAELPKSTTETLSPDTLGQISSSFEEAELVADTLPATSAAQLITAAQQAFTDGKDVAIAVAFISVAIGLALVWFKYPRRNEEIKLFTEVHQSEP
jgi:MFS family permease